MKEDQAYLSIAKRYLKSCEDHIQNNINIQEAICFKSYHAFESIAGAYNSHFNVVIPRAHAKKLRVFIETVRVRRFIDGRAVAIVAGLLNSIRDKSLYPEELFGKYVVPADQLSLSDAKRLVKGVAGIIRRIEKLI